MTTVSVPGASRPPFVPGGLATGIGSLPHLDPAVAVEAVAKALPEIPFWPQLPRRDVLEGMTLQYVEGFPGLAGGGTEVDTGSDSAEALGRFFESKGKGDDRPFGLSPERAPGFHAFTDRLDRGVPEEIVALKAHVTGPVTLASSLKDPGGRELTHDPTFFEVVAAWVAEKARWQIRRLAGYGVPVIVFLDEPVMEVYGSAYSSLSREQVLGLWGPTLEATAAEGALSGIHCCGNTDWGLLFECGTDIVNFDAFHFLEKMLLYPQQAGAFLRRGGVIAWGIVPTSPEVRGQTADGLADTLTGALGRFAAAGVPEDLLWRQCLVTPSCGMGSLDPALCERVLELLGGVSRKIRARVDGGDR